MDTSITETIVTLNYCLVKIDRLQENIHKMSNGAELLLYFNQTNGAEGTTNGILIKKPAAVKWMDGFETKCEIDAEEGDRVWWEGVYSNQQIKDRQKDAVFVFGDDLYMFVPCPFFTAADRDGEIIPLNGHVIVEKLPHGNLKSNMIYIPDFVKSDNTEVVKCRVVAAPKSLPEYKHHGFKNTEVKKGDIIYVPEFTYSPLDPTHVKSTEYFKVYSRYILAKE